MYSKRLFLVAGLSILCLASACNKDEGEDNSLNQHDRDFMNNATYINLAEVETGDLARQKAESPVVEDYGAMMLSDHGKAHNELSDIAQEDGYSLPLETDQKHKDQAAMLMNLSGRAFDSTYIYMMVAGHEDAIILFQSQVDNGQNVDLKKYASDKLPALQAHRTTADSIAKNMYPQP